jgi:hypothetical protein
MSKLSWRLGFLAMAIAAPGPIQAEPSAQTVIASLDLTAPFAARSEWRFVASQGPPIGDPAGLPGDRAPGEITLCLRGGASGGCDPQLRSALRPPTGDDSYAQAHDLKTARIVHGRAGRPLLFVQTASVASGDGDQLVLTQALAYDRGADRFVRVFDHLTGKNNDQEVRFVETGPLKGDIIVAEPTQNAPFGFWISVNALAPGSSYRQVLRFRSATRYGDNNPLAVIDSDMPNIEQHLGLWRPGAPLPLPAGPCPAPHLVHMELWCR